MKQLLLLIVAIVFGIAVWRIADKMSADAVGLAVGVVFGVLAGLPAAILMLASSRRRRDEGDDRQQRQQQPPYGYGGQPPVIVLTGGMQPQQALPEPLNGAGAAGGLSQQEERSFHWVGVQEGAEDE